MKFASDRPVYIGRHIKPWPRQPLWARWRGRAETWPPVAEDEPFLPAEPEGNHDAD